MEAAFKSPPLSPRGAAALLRVFVGAGDGDSGGAGAAVVRRLQVGNAKVLRAAHPRLAPAVAALDWRWASESGCAVMLELSGGRRAARAAAHFAAALPRAACRVVLVYTPRHPESATPTMVASAAASATANAVAVVRCLPPSLRAACFHFGARPPDAEVMEALCRRARSLCTLELGNTAATAASLAALPPSLRVIRAAYTSLPASGMRLSHVTALAVLDVYGARFSDDDVAALPCGLVCLKAPHTALTEAARFDHLPHLRVLNVDRTDVGDASLASAPPRLVRLYAMFTLLTAAARFGHLRRLRHLCVDRTRLGDASLASIASANLRVLEVSHTALSDGARFAHLPRLRSLGVHNTAVGDAALASLPPRLQRLGASNTAATALAAVAAKYAAGTARAAIARPSRGHSGAIAGP